MSRIDGTPSVQVTVPLTDAVHCWLDTFADETPVLAIETGVVELCLVLPSGPVSGAQLRTAHSLAETAAAFALRISRAAACQDDSAP